jgi:methylase of polypeptide subunit release factors
MKNTPSIYRYALCIVVILTLSVTSGCAHREKHDANPQLVYLQPDPQHPDQWRAHILGKEFIVLPKVDPPSADSFHLLRHTRIQADENVLDMGTGSGVQAVFAAKYARHVVATDINPAAGRNARLNIQRFGLEQKIEVRIGDLFAPIKPQERFDVILLNIEYPNSKTDLSPWIVHERFFANVRAHLKTGGRIYYQTGYRRNLPAIYTMLKKNGLQTVAEHFAPSVLEGEEHITLEIQVQH